jgi:hypothetical protein
LYPQAHLCIKGEIPDRTRGIAMPARQTSPKPLAPRLARLTVLSACALLSVTAACSRVPQLEDRLPADLRSQPYPQLLPLDTALAQEPLPEEESAELSEALDARADRLRSRAEALRRRQP